VGLSCSHCTRDKKYGPRDGQVEGMSLLDPRVCICICGALFLGE
jgi:hypothetical protein